MLQQDTPFGCSIKASKTLIINGLRAYYILACDFWVNILGLRYKTDVSQIQNLLLNINQSIYGKIYFPVYSNRLKEIGHYIGATGSSSNASGIQSLVWRNQWEETQNEQHKDTLITYNYEDCKALKILVDKLSSIQESANTLSEIDFAINPKKIQQSRVNKSINNLIPYLNLDMKIMIVKKFPSIALKMLRCIMKENPEDK